MINVSIGKDWYLPGEQIEVKIAVDNREGEKDLDGFSVKLVREVTA